MYVIAVLPYEWLEHSYVPTRVPSSSVDVAIGVNIGWQCRNFWSFSNVSRVFPISFDQHSSLSPSPITFNLSYPFHNGILKKYWLAATVD